MYCVLLVEDDEQLCEVTGAFLEASGFVVDPVSTAEDCWEKVSKKTYDIIILDLGLPDEDGLVLLRKLGNAGIDTPVVICSGRSSDEDKIAGLEFGAHDYLAKPFRVKELLLRINILLKRNGSAIAKPKIVSLGDTSIDLQNRYVTDGQQNEISLTAQEQAVLFVLLENAPRVYSREELIDATRFNSGPDSTRAIDTTISRLRKKLEPNPKTPQLIKTVQGSGYRGVLL